MLKIGLTGGIGSGKSTAARIFRTLGVPVYDSDTRARELMHGEQLRQQITDIFGAKAYCNGHLDRGYIASLVFSDRNLLDRLNSVVHPCVMRDFELWAEKKQKEGCKYVIQENAILFDHGFDVGMDSTITITAPVEERVERAVQRDGHDPDDIRRRMANQMTDAQRQSRADYTIINGERDLIVPQIERLHSIFIATDE